MTDAINGVVSAHLDNLTHAYSDYKVEVTARVQPKAFTWACFTPSDERSSQRAIIRFKTTGRAPDFPPNIASGSFRYEDEKLLHVFAESLPPEKRNDDTLEYVFNTTDRADIPMRFANDRAINHVLYYNFDFTDVDTVVSVRSQNSFGLSRAANYISVPRYSRLCPQPSRIEYIITLDIQYLVWRPPSRQSLTKYCREITSYTIFEFRGYREIRGNCL